MRVCRSATRPGQDRHRLARPQVCSSPGYHQGVTRRREARRVGVLQRFERRLEGMVEGTFARVFKSELQPVEVASAVQHEMDERAAIVARAGLWSRTISSSRSHSPTPTVLTSTRRALAWSWQRWPRDHATEQGYSFVGPVRIRFEGVPDLGTGVFRIRSGVIRGHTVEAGEVRQPVSDLPKVGRWAVSRQATACRVRVAAGHRRGGRQHL